ncbi:MAG TPA: alpha/beta hydrolase [Chitinophagaceae bacterium]|nr:alpha/beta hydrolase [Chitinophagaceae bacterium]
MRKLLIITTVLSFPGYLFPQTQPSTGGFGQIISIKEYQGQDFRLEVAVKLRVLDTSAQISLFASVNGKVNNQGKGKGLAFYKKAILPTDSNWKLYSLEGKLDNNAHTLTIGSSYSEKGIYFFDDFRLFIISKNGETHEIPVIDPGFETDSLVKWWYSASIPIYKAEPTAETSYTGSHSFKVDCSKRVKFFTYGKNDAVGNYTDVNGVRLYYETYGTGKPILLLHGNGQSIGVWSRQIFEFSKYYQVIAVDTRGHGRSSEDGRKYSYDLFAEDINAFLDFLHVDSIPIVGWSDGGNTALILAMKHPGKVGSLVTMGANICINTTVVPKSEFKKVNKGIDYFKQDTSYDSRNKVRLLTMLLTEPNYQFKDLAAIRCPVLIMAGEKDIILPDHTKGIAAHIQKGRLLIAPNETHFFPQENPASFNKIILDFLRE